LKASFHIALGLLAFGQARFKKILEFLPSMLSLWRLMKKPLSGSKGSILGWIVLGIFCLWFLCSPCLAVTQVGVQLLETSNSEAKVLDERFIAIAAGGYHSLALRLDGTVVGWGDNSAGQISIPAGLTNVVAITAAGSLSLALRSDGTVVSWGRNNWDYLNFPVGLSNIVAIAAGGFGMEYGLALRTDGTVVGWGANLADRISIPAGLKNVIAISAGGNQSAALRSDGTVVCWGWGSGGLSQISLGDVVAISLGSMHGLALRSDGTVTGWGNNSAGQIDIPNGLKSVVAISGGMNSVLIAGTSLALRSDGTVIGWGRSFDGQLTIPVGLTNVVAIASGISHSLALRSDGTVVGWGGNDFGQVNIPIQGDLAPMIHSQPKSRIIEVGSNDSLELVVNATGASPLSYQWKKDGEFIMNANGKVFLKNDFSVSDGGMYQVAVSNQYGNLTSEPARVSVFDYGTPLLLVNNERVLKMCIIADKAEISLFTAFPKGSIYYTLDNSDPSVESILFSKSYIVTNSTIVRAISFNNQLTEMKEMEPIQIRITPGYILETKASLGGSLKRNPDRGRYAEDDLVELTAEAVSGYKFVRWEGDLMGASANITVVMNRSRNLRAVFDPIPTTRLTITECKGEWASFGWVMRSEPGQQYELGTLTRLRAVASDGCRFLGWTGDVDSTNAVLDLVMDRDKEVKALFGTKITVSQVGNGTLHIEPVLECYPYGSTVHVVPVPDQGYYLGLWGGDVVGRERGPIDVVITNATPLLTARFMALPANKFTVIATGDSGGVVRLSPSGASYGPGEKVTLTAQPLAGYEFAGWSGDASGMENPFNLVVSTNLVVQAHFGKVAGMVVQVAVTSLHGTVRRNPNLAVYEQGMEVDFIAEPDAGYGFAGWSGAWTGIDTQVKQMLNSDVAVTALFKPLYTLTIENSGDGSVLTSPKGIQFIDGAEVILTASPGAGNGFVMWTGDVESADQQIRLTMDSNKRVIASFGQYGKLTTSVRGRGAVKRNPDQASYLPGALVELKAEAETGWAFDHWEGQTTGTNSTVQIHVDKPMAVIASFRDAVAPVVTLTEPVNGTVADERFQLSGNIVDNGTIKSAFWKINDGQTNSIQIQTNGEFTVPGLVLRSGTNDIQVGALDYSGNQSATHVLVTWMPSRTLAVVNPSEQVEGKKITVPVELISQGDVGGMSFVLHYETNYLKEPEFTWSSIVGSSLNQVNYDMPGEIRASFALPATAIPTGTQLVAQVSFRTRSVPEDLATPFLLEVKDVANASGEQIRFGTDIQAGSVRILRRRIQGDNNSNNRLDIGDATLIQRFVTGLEQARSWDITGNDLNRSQALDSGDVIMALRVVAGIDPQPQLLGAKSIHYGSDTPVVSDAARSLLKATSETLGTSTELAFLAPSLLSGKTGDSVTIQVVLTNLQTTIAGATFTLNYATNALRLINAASLQIGAFVPANSVVVWNVAPSQNNYSVQSGRVTLAASSAVAWLGSNGILAELTFQVQSTAASKEPWALTLNGMEITPNGYDNRQLPEATAAFTFDGVIPVIVAPTLSSTGLKYSINGFAVTLSGDLGIEYILEASTNLNSWTPIQTNSGASGPLELRDSTTGVYRYRFYRAKVR
jgi:hypothetical protein